MASFYLDTSALLKRYLYEQGTNWITNTVFASGNYLSIARIAHVEVASTLARKVRGNLLTTADETQLMKLLAISC